MFHLLKKINLQDHLNVKKSCLSLLLIKSGFSHSCFSRSSSVLSTKSFQPQLGKEGITSVRTAGLYPSENSRGRGKPGLWALLSDCSAAPCAQWAGEAALIRPWLSTLRLFPLWATAGTRFPLHPYQGWIPYQFCLECHSKQEGCFHWGQKGRFLGCILGDF